LHDAFARVVASIGDPEWRRERRAVLLAAAALLAVAMAVFVFVVPSLSRVFIVFSVAFAVGIVADLAILNRRFHRRP